METQNRQEVIDSLTEEEVRGIIRKLTPEEIDDKLSAFQREGIVDLNTEDYPDGISGNDEWQYDPDEDCDVEDGINEIDEEDVLEFINNVPDYQKRDFLCDIADVRHTDSDSTIIEAIVNKFLKK